MQNKIIVGTFINNTSVFLLENPMNNMKRQKDRTLKEELPRSVGTQYVTGDQWVNNLKTKLKDEAKAKTTPICGSGW